MKRIRVMACSFLLASFGAAAHADEFDTVHFDDAAWVKSAGDRLARCAGTYRGAAAVLRERGRKEAATYAENVASGALFASYLLLTSQTAVDGKVLEDVDTNVHIEALAWGTKRNFSMMEAQRDPHAPEVLRDCARTGALQSAVLRDAAGTPGATGIRQLADARPQAPAARSEDPR
jgi:hypothetical protein